MSTWSGGAAPATTFDDWWRRVEETFVPLDVRTERRDDFRGGLAHRRLGAVRISEVSGVGPTRMIRARTQIRRGDPEMYWVEVQTYGTCVITQDDRQALLKPGDFTIVDSSRPYQRASDDGVSGFVSLSFPRVLLPLPYERVAAVTGTRMQAGRGVDALVPAFIDRLACHMDEYHPAEMVRLSTVVLDLVTMAFAHRLGAPAVSGDARDRGLLLAVQTFIEEHLHDAGLSPKGIAAAHNISVRQLYRLFEAHRLTVAGWIRTRRLEGVRRDLTDPARRSVPIGAVAARWGFSAAHLSRLFKKSYGMTPGEFRLLHRPARPSRQASTEAASTRTATRAKPSG